VEGVSSGTGGYVVQQVPYEMGIGDGVLREAKRVAEYHRERPQECDTSPALA
jgi:hypothetical protein